MAVDEALLKPLAESWVEIVPSPSRRGVRNFFGNLGDGWSVVNHVLQGKPEPALNMTLRMAVIRYCAAGLVVAVAGGWLPFVGNEIAETMGWKTSFVGTLLIAGATSLPELVVTVSALRLGAVDMAIGNLLGSNLFGILILAIDDIAYTKGPLLSAVSPAHAISAFAAVIMSGIFIVALLYRPKTRVRGTIGWVSLPLLLVYLFASYAIYMHGH